MTSLNNRHQSGRLSPSSFTPNPAQSNDAYFAALAPSFRAVLSVAILLFSKFCVAAKDGVCPDFDQNSKKVKIAALALILFMIALPGSREKKNEFFHRVFERLYAKRNARLKELRAEYIIWRQRKCWMWGGGFMASTLMSLPNFFEAAQDKISFDLRIPD